MTVNELIDHLERLQRQGLGTRRVEMGGPDYDEVTGIFWSDHESRICLESVNWSQAIVCDCDQQGNPDLACHASDCVLRQGPA